jgi:hypothetical protein
MGWRKKWKKIRKKKVICRTDKWNKKIGDPFSLKNCVLWKKGEEEAYKRKLTEADMTERIEVFICPKCGKVLHHHVWKEYEGELAEHLKEHKDKWVQVVKICPDCQQGD